MRLAIPLTFLAFLLLTGCGSDTEEYTISSSEALNMIESDSGVVVLDVRTPEEFKGELGHLEGAILIPVQDLERRIDELSEYGQKSILAYCRTGRRSLKATEILREHGYHAFNVEGGMVGWNNSHHPHVVQEE